MQEDKLQAGCQRINSVLFKARGVQLPDCKYNFFSGFIQFFIFGVKNAPILVTCAHFGHPILSEFADCEHSLA
jgi:hypothetical protein